MKSWQSFLDSILSCDNKSFDSLLKERNEFRIMKYFLENTTIRKKLSTWFYELECHQKENKKNTEKSQMYRLKGNAEFKKKNFFLSIKFFTLSLQLAPWDSEMLSLAFANRSAASFYLKKYEECLKDINMALDSQYPTDLLYKLYLRAAHCYSNLRNKKLMDEAIDKVQKCLKNNNTILNLEKVNVQKEVEKLSHGILIEQDNIELKKEPNLPDLAFGKNPIFANASAALDLKFSQDKGRHIIANRNITKGQVLFVEKPFAFVLLDGNDIFICANCCKSEELIIPCKFCVNTVYCSLKCRTEAWTTFHQWECFGNQIDLWNQIGIAHLTVRTFLNCCYVQNNLKFNEIQNLVTNIDKLNRNDIFVYGVSALMMVIYFEKFTSFFDGMDVFKNIISKFEPEEQLNIISQYSMKTSNNNSVLFTSGIIFKHLLQLVCNGHAITKLDQSTHGTQNTVTEYQSRVATAIYPSASMMNHSCNSNIINSFENQYLIVKATKNISANEEVYNCYGPHYRRMKKIERELALNNQYCFSCSCEACTDPKLQNFSERFEKFNCINCNGPAEVINKSKIQMQCLDCRSNFNWKQNDFYQLHEATEYYEAALKFLDSRNYQLALDKAKNCLEIRKRFLYKYHEAVTMSYDLIGKILAIEGKWFDSITYLEVSFRSIEERFGPDSIELANEINKITDICLQYLNEGVNINTQQYKDIFKKTRDFLNQALEILDLNYGPWNNTYQEIVKKLEDFMPLALHLNL